jgi:hypothetical protein
MVSPLSAWARGPAAILALAAGVDVPPVQSARTRCARPLRPDDLLSIAVRRGVNGDTASVRLGDGLGLVARADEVPR